jgi:hypothetical protein
MSDETVDKNYRAAGPWNPDWWTPEKRAAASAAWTTEKRAAMSAYRKAHPQGNRSKAWWAARRKAEKEDKR